MIEKWLIPLGIVGLFFLGLYYYSVQVSDEMALSLLGYSQQDITLIKKEKPELVEPLVMLSHSTSSDEQYSDYIDFILAKDFDIKKFDAYITLSTQYSQLKPAQIVFLDHISETLIYPKLKKLGYSAQTIDQWLITPQVMQYIQNEDGASIEALLAFAALTGDHVQQLVQYTNYHDRFKELSLNDVVKQVNQFQTETMLVLNQKGYTKDEILKLYDQFSVPELNVMAMVDIKPDVAMELMMVSQFDAYEMPAYSEVLTQSKNTSATYAIQYVKYQNVKNNFYLDIVPTSVREDNFTFVNPNYVLPASYKPDDLVLLNVPLYHLSSLTESNYLRKEAAEAIKKLFDAAKAEKSFQFMVRCGFRSYETQKEYYNKFKKSEGLTYADTMSSRPGHSEHQTGLAIDVTIPGADTTYSEDFGQSPEGIWLAENAHRFGFIIRYPFEQSTEVGYSYEPWHLRYVGTSAATEIHDKNWLFEDYVLEYQLLDEIN